MVDKRFTQDCFHHGSFFSDGSGNGTCPSCEDGVTTCLCDPEALESAGIEETVPCEKFTDDGIGGCCATCSHPEECHPGFTGYLTEN